MLQDELKILTINSGSSSIKFALYNQDENPVLQASGKIQKIGSADTSFEYKGAGNKTTHTAISAKNITEAASWLTSWLEKNIGFKSIAAVGHRIVHGMNHTQPAVIDHTLLEELKTISRYDPDHLPGAIALIAQIQQASPNLLQAACFDTSFHSGLPRVAEMMPLPRRFEKEGIKRYGFHGISYQYLVEKLFSIGGAALANGKLVLAHLGSGASMAAVKNGKCIDTSMGFTPAGGFMMGTRTGDLDPGIISWLLQEDKLNAKELDELFNHESGLLGVSGTTADMGELLKTWQTDTKAAEAIDLFCYQVKKNLCAYAGVLGGPDTIVFTGGIGENAFQVRTKICAGLDFLGIQIDEKKNRQNELLVSATGSKVAVYVIPANEEYMISKSTIELLNQSNNKTIK